MVVINCKQCNNEFEVKPSNIKNGKKYCSKKCYTLSQTKKITAICQACGKNFEMNPSNLKYGRGKFCSRKCAAPNRQQKMVERICKICNNKFIGSTRQTLCSPECKKESRRRVVKKNNDKSKERKAKWYRETHQYKIKVCEICGKKFNPNGRDKTCSLECSKQWQARYKDEHQMELRKCIICGNEFRTYKHNPASHCSKECQNASSKKRIECVCIHCGQTFEEVPSRIKEGKGKFCSTSCHNEWRSINKSGKNSPRWNRVSKNCLYCGNSFYASQSKIKEGKGKFCSKECSDNYHVREKSSAWKGGISFAPYCPKFNNEFKERVRDFWHRECGICGQTEQENGKKLSVHHVNYNKMACCDDIPPLFITTCNSCHPVTNFNREYWESILTELIMIWFDGESYLPK